MQLKLDPEKLKKLKLPPQNDSGGTTILTSNMNPYKSEGTSVLTSQMNPYAEEGTSVLTSDMNSFNKEEGTSVLTSQDIPKHFNEQSKLQQTRQQMSKQTRKPIQQNEEDDWQEPANDFKPIPEQPKKEEKPEKKKPKVNRAQMIQQAAASSNAPEILTSDTPLIDPSIQSKDPREDLDKKHKKQKEPKQPKPKKEKLQKEPKQPKEPKPKKEKQPKEGKKSTKILWICMITFGILLCVGFLVYIMFIDVDKKARFNDKKDIAEKFFDSITMQDYDSYVHIMGSKLSDGSSTEPFYDQFITYNVKFDTSTLKEKSSKDNNDTNITIYNIAYSYTKPDTHETSNITQDFEFTLQKEEDLYYLVGIKSIDGTSKPIDGKQSKQIDKDKTSNTKVIYTAVTEALSDENLFDKVLSSMIKEDGTDTLILTNLNGDVFGSSKQEVYHAGLKDKVNELLNNEPLVISVDQVAGIVPDGYGVTYNNKDGVKIWAIKHQGNGVFLMAELYPNVATDYIEYTAY